MSGIHRSAAGRTPGAARARIIPLLCCFLSLLGCDESGTGPYVPPDSVGPYTQISLECIDLVAWGAMLQVVVNSQAEYDALTYEYFQLPLDQWRESAFPILLESVRRDYPGLPDAEQIRIAEERLYDYYPFKGTKGCVQPAIDFTRFTLLGCGTMAAGCTAPDYRVDVTTDQRKMTSTMTVSMVQHGWCDAAHYKIIWMVVPKIPPWYTVSFAITSTTVEKSGGSGRLAP